MSMFDYDARPVTPVPVLVGTTASRGAYAIRDFLSRNGYPFEWVDAGQPDAVRAVLGVAEVEPSALPLCILPDGSRLASATVEQVAEGLGMVAAPARSEYDLAIVGAGPAGLAAAVNAASEGLRTVVVEAVAPGGQDLAGHVAPGKVLVPPLVLGMHGPGGHGDRAGHIPGRRHCAIPGDLAEDAPDRDGPPTRSCSSAGPRISDLVIWFNWQIGAPRQAIP
jgi:FAD binding domain